MTCDVLNLGINLVDDALIFEAASATAVKNSGVKQFHYKLSAAFAACILIVAACILIPNLVGNGPDGNGPNHIQPTPSIDNRLVVKGDPNTDDGFMETEAEGVRVSFGLLEALENPQYKNALFHVRIHANLDGVLGFTYEGKALDEWSNAPILLDYNKAFEAWIIDEYPDLDAEMREREKNGDPDAQGWGKHDVETVFYEYWSASQTDETIIEHKTAREAMQNATSAYNEWLHSSEQANAAADAMLEETDRLIALGFDVKLSDGHIVGNLTKEQIVQFPATANTVYYIGWNGDNDE